MGWAEWFTLRSRSSAVRQGRYRASHNERCSRKNVRPLPLHCWTDLMSHLELVALVVREYEPAIDFFVKVLQFELAEDVPSLTNDGRPKRWVVVRPAGGGTG